jgi:hypothetical protein
VLEEKHGSRIAVQPLVYGHALQRFPDRPRVPHELAQGAELRQPPAPADEQSKVCAAGDRDALAEQCVRRRERNPVVDMI